MHGILLVQVLRSITEHRVEVNSRISEIWYNSTHFLEFEISVATCVFSHLARFETSRYRDTALSHRNNIIRSKA